MMIRCPSCRTLLNTDLELSDAKAPTYQPLKVVDGVEVAVVRGVFVECKACRQPMKARSQFVGKTVCCKNCEAPVFVPPNDDGTLLGGYADCPHCGETLNLSVKHFSGLVRCKSCRGTLRPKLPSPHAEVASR